MHGTLCIALFASVQIRPPSAYRLIFSGKVLSDTAALLSTLGISDRRTVHLAEGNALDAAVVPIGPSSAVVAISHMLWKTSSRLTSACVLLELAAR
jgi:hypothetical protein